MAKDAVLPETAITCMAAAKPGVASVAVLRDGWQQRRGGGGQQGLPPSRLPITPSWYQAVHMPRWASRLTLLVTHSRIESLQAISDADARAEGVGDSWRFWLSPRARFSRAWNQTRGTPGERWEDDPSVIALTFTRIS